MELLVKNLLFTLLLPGTVALWVPLFAFSNGAPDRSLATIGGALLLGIGAAIYTWCEWDFATAGRGTPAPIDPPTELVVRGLYRYIRNPMYVGVLCVIAGWALLFQSGALALYALCVAVAFHLFVRLYEEPHLTRTFGAPYETYCARTHRWLPRFDRQAL